MTTKNTAIVSSFEKRIDKKRRELLLHQTEVRDFVKTQYEAEKFKEHLEKLDRASTEIGTILIELIALKATFRKAALELEKRGDGLKTLAAETKGILSEDSAEKQRLELEKKQLKRERELDLIKVGTFVVVFPVMLVNGVHNIFGPGSCCL